MVCDDVTTNNTGAGRRLYHTVSLSNIRHQVAVGSLTRSLPRNRFCDTQTHKICVWLVWPVARRLESSA